MSHVRPQVTGRVGQEALDQGLSFSPLCLLPSPPDRPGLTWNGARCPCLVPGSHQSWRHQDSIYHLLAWWGRSGWSSWERSWQHDPPQLESVPTQVASEPWTSSSPASLCPHRPFSVPRMGSSTWGPQLLLSILKPAKHPTFNWLPPGEVGVRIP
jgi:hypothetical protein